MSAIQTIRNTVNGLDEISGIIADPDSGGPVRQAIGRSGQLVCNAYANAQLVANFIGPARAAVELVCKPYLDGGGFDSPVLQVPFSGGQCAGDAYTLSYSTFVATIADCIDPSFTVTQTITGGVFATNIIGPIQSMTTVLDTPGPCGPRFLRVRVVTPTVDILFPITNVGQNSVFISGNPSYSVSNQSGPDDCGDLPGQLVPGTNPPPAPGPFPPGEEPGVDPDGQPFFFIPDIDLPGFDPLPIDDEPLGENPGAGPSTPAGGDGLPGEPDAIGGEAGEVTGEEGGEDIDFGDPPEGKIWVGCIVEMSADSRIGNIPETGPQSTVWPSVRGNVALKYGQFYSTSTRINSRFTEKFRPVSSLIVTGAFLQVQPGGIGKVFPISALKCPLDPCGE